MEQFSGKKNYYKTEKVKSDVHITGSNPRNFEWLKLISRTLFFLTKFIFKNNGNKERFNSF